jgi:hypothetical protein
MIPGHSVLYYNYEMIKIAARCRWWRCREELLPRK